MFPWLVMAGVVLAAQYGSHIAISWFLDRIPVSARRVIVVLNCFILMAAYAALAWGTYTLMPIVSSERTQVLQVPSSVTYSCMLAAFLLMIVTSLTQAIRLIITKGSDAPKTLLGQMPGDH
jgi:TRAP-type C4-dicarboxylate transport system permease small subunit